MPKLLGESATCDYAHKGVMCRAHAIVYMRPIPPSDDILPTTEPLDGAAAGRDYSESVRTGFYIWETGGWLCRNHAQACIARLDEVRTDLQRRLDKRTRT